MPNPWAILAGLATLLAGMITAAAYTHHVDGLVLHIYQAKVAAVAEKAAADSQAKARAIEANAQLQQASIIQRYEQKLYVLSQKHHQTLRTLYALQRVYDTDSGTDRLPSIAGTPGRINDARLTRFSAKDVRFLVYEAERADKLVAKVTALQQLVKADRVKYHQ